MSNFTNESVNITCIQTSSGLTLLNLGWYVSVGILEAIMIICSNILVLTSLIKFPQLRLTSNILIGNLAISDLLVGLILLPVNVVSVVFPTFTDTRFGCIWKCFNWIFVTGSAFLSLLLISIDRLCAVTLPLKYKTTATKQWAVMACIGCWMGWTIACFLIFTFNIWHCSKICTLANVTPQLAFQFVTFFLGCVFLVSFVAFVIIVFRLRKFDNQNVFRGTRDVKRRTGIMALVFGLFVFFLIPLLISAVYASTVNVIENRLIMEWLILIAALNSVLNGAIYGLKRLEFRRAYLSILTCKTKQNRIVPWSSDQQ